MNVGEFKRKVKEAGELKIGKVVFTHRVEDADIDGYIGDRLFAWVGGSQSDMLSMDLVMSFSTHDALNDIPALSAIAQYIGIKVGEVEPIQVIKEVKLEDTDKFVLQGKVEAYEKILIGRGINVTK